MNHKFRVTVEGECASEGSDAELGRRLHERMSEFVYEREGLDKGGGVHELREVEIEVTTDVRETLGTAAEWWTATALETAQETLWVAFPGLTAVRNREATTELERAQHLLWMCGEIQGLVDLGHREKAMRWLGFVQGSFWLMGLRSIDAMRKDNGPA